MNFLKIILSLLVSMSLLSAAAAPEGERELARRIDAITDARDDPVEIHTLLDGHGIVQSSDQFVNSLYKMIASNRSQSFPILFNHIEFAQLPSYKRLTLLQAAFQFRRTEICEFLLSRDLGALQPISSGSFRSWATDELKNLITHHRDKAALFRPSLSEFRAVHMLNVPQILKEIEINAHCSGIDHDVTRAGLLTEMLRELTQRIYHNTDEELVTVISSLIAAGAVVDDLIHTDFVRIYRNRPQAANVLKEALTIDFKEPEESNY